MRTLIGLLSLVLLVPAPVGAEQEPQQRTFDFTYSATVTGLKPGQTARVWLPVPSSGPNQKVRILKRQLPARGKIAREAKFGNRILFVEAKANDTGQVPVSMTYRITRDEVRALPDKGGKPVKGTDMEDALDRYLAPATRVPIAGKPLELLKGKELPRDALGTARSLYDVVYEYMRYSKEGTGWGHGDAVWACQSGYGNCSDFHSLFISLARSRHIPARFEIGFPLPPRGKESGARAGVIPGYHCWGWFHLDKKGWVPVDISEARKHPELRTYYFGNLTEDRVAFSTGRDVDLVPQQAGPAINFLIYPHVEVEGKVYPQEKIIRKFTYKDVE
jgi:transglutaminase-like putative cysteine protease